MMINSGYNSMNESINLKPLTRINDNGTYDRLPDGSSPLEYEGKDYLLVITGSTDGKKVEICINTNNCLFIKSDLDKKSSIELSNKVVDKINKELNPDDISNEKKLSNIILSFGFKED